MPSLLPTITQQSAAASTCRSGSATFSVTATGTSPSYRWQWRPQGTTAWLDMTPGNNIDPYSGVHAFDASGPDTANIVLGNIVGTVASSNAAISSRREIHVVVSNPCGSVTSDTAQLILNSADFNGDGDIGTDGDIEAFFACLAGHCCATCGSADFNGDGDIGTDADIEAFFRVLAGGSC